MDGETEQVNQEVETYLWMFCQGQPDKWSELIPMAEFVHNSATHSSTQKSPLNLILGYEPRDYPKIGQTFLPSLEDRLTLLDQAWDEALAAHEEAQQLMKEQITTKFILWKVGDKVWLKGKNLCLWYPTKKLAPRQEGLFEISQVVSPIAYHLHLLLTWKIHNVFHVSLLSMLWFRSPFLYKLLYFFHFDSSLLQSFFLIIPLCSLFILTIYLLGEEDAILT